MNVVKIRVENHVFEELRRLAGSAKTDVEAVVVGIVKVYLNQEIQTQKSDPRRDRLAGAVLEAVRVYEEDGGKKPAKNPKSSGPRLSLTNSQIIQALKLRKLNFTWAEVADAVGCSADLARHTLAKPHRVGPALEEWNRQLKD